MQFGLPTVGHLDIVLDIVRLNQDNYASPAGS